MSEPKMIYGIVKTYRKYPNIAYEIESAPIIHETEKYLYVDKYLIWEGRISSKRIEKGHSAIYFTAEDAVNGLIARLEEERIDLLKEAEGCNDRLSKAHELLDNLASNTHEE